jgi:uncharacterized protein (TIGR02001 family)
LVQSRDYGRGGSANLADLTRDIFEMTGSRKLISLCGAAGIALIALSGAALADGYEYEGKAMAAPDEGRKFTYSFGLAGTSDYVFRGISQTDNDPTIQGSIDIGYGIFYAGVWGSGLDFGGPPSGGLGLDAQAEFDWYAGIKPSWNTHISFIGKVDFDFGVIYYTYPGTNDFLAESDYVEFKAGYSSSFWSFLIPGVTSGTTIYYSPDYFLETGGVWTVESSYAWEGHEIRGITPTINAVLGWQTGDLSEGYSTNFAGTDDDFYYWNAGLALAVGNITFDFRYWDTDIGNIHTDGGFCVNAGLCDERFVATVSVSVP